jgi:hypothetical protein
MQFIYGKAPIKYTNGVPSHLAGEWPGITSCKFHSYKRVIHPVSSGIIFNQKELPAPVNRKLLGPKGPTPEYVFKPCCKMVQQIFERGDRPEGIRYIPFPSKTPIPRKERRHNFPYKEEMDKIEVEKIKNMTNSNMVMKEFKLLSLIGFAKKPYEGLPYIIKPGNKFNRNLLNSIQIDDNYEDRKNMTKKQIRSLERKKRIEEKKNLGNDIKYVEDLIKWDKKYIYKPVNQPEEPSPNNDDNNNQEKDNSKIN